VAKSFCTPALLTYTTIAGLPISRLGCPNQIAARPHLGSVGRRLRCLFLALDRLSFIEALHGHAVEPDCRLALALLISKGLRWSHQARYPSTFHFSGKALGSVT
jgi:hypothetical protein